MKRWYLWVGVTLILFMGCKKDSDVDDTPNTNITMDGDIIHITDSPVIDPHRMELFGLALKKKDLADFNKKLSSNQYGFKALKENELVDYDGMWESFYNRYLVVMRATGEYHGEDITLNVRSGEVTIGDRKVRVYELGHIFDSDNKIPMGSGVATLLGAKPGEEYYVVWLLVTHGSSDEHNFVTVTHLNKPEAMQAKSIYTITEK